MEKYSGVRIESRNGYRIREAVKHDFRIKKTANISRPEEENYYYFNDNEKGFNFKKSYKEIEKMLSESEEKHKILYKQKHKKNININRTNSLNMGVFYFSASMTEDLKINPKNKQAFINIGIQAIKKMNEELGTKILYITVHFDEKTPHFQWVSENFDENCNPSKHREKGSILQDIGGEFSIKMGYKRGNKKIKTSAKNKKRLECNLAEIENQQQQINTLKNSVKKGKSILAQFDDEIKKAEKFKIVVQQNINDAEKRLEIYKTIIDEYKTELQAIKNQIKLLKIKNLDEIHTLQERQKIESQIKQTTQKMKQSLKSHNLDYSGPEFN